MAGFQAMIRRYVSPCAKYMTVRSERHRLLQFMNGRFRRAQRERKLLRSGFRDLAIQLRLAWTKFVTA